GNDNSDVLHYPSAFDEVISVATSDESDRKAGFSSFGNTVDIYAPGVNMLTASRTGLGNPEFGNNYMYANGTSFSAPVVAAIAAVLKERNPSLNNEEIRGLLISTSRYFSSQSGWDYVYSSGIVSASGSFQNYNNPSTARIYNPSLNQSFTSSNILFYISAASAFFTSYSIGYGIGSKAQNFTQIYSSSSQVIRDSVYKWNISGIPDTAISLQLKINANNGKTIEHRTIIGKDTKIPAITGYYSNEILFNDDFAESISFNTAKPTLGMVYIKRKGINEPYRVIYTDEGNIGFYSDYHYTELKHGDLNPATEYEYYLQVKGLNGPTVNLTDTNFTFITKSKINKTGFIKKSYNLPLSQVCGTVEDILNNGKKTLLTNSVQNSLNIEAYNFSGNGFIKISGN
ncbi:MAG: S8 family serine peptidase, partial [Ignavibacteria bacterium]|nr:S8 family serine peptidase [Ignavibacteria bacterium]